jgi:hypothetical protein
MFVSLMIFLGWALVGAWRAMRANCALPTGRSSGWPIWLYMAFYQAGFESLASVSCWRRFRRRKSPELRNRVRPCWPGLCGCCFDLQHGVSGAQGSGASALAGRAGAAGQFYKAFRALEAWMLSYGVVLVGSCTWPCLMTMDQSRGRADPDVRIVAAGRSGHAGLSYPRCGDLRSDAGLGWRARVISRRWRCWQRCIWCCPPDCTGWASTCNFLLLPVIYEGAFVGVLIGLGTSDCVHDTGDHAASSVATRFIHLLFTNLALWELSNPNAS